MSTFTNLFQNEVSRALKPNVAKMSHRIPFISLTYNPIFREIA